MVYSSRLPFHALTLDELVNRLFYRWDDHIKPPASIGATSLNSTEYEDVKIQFALAGYKEEDLKVYYEKNVLFIEGSNEHRENVFSKFKNTFKHAVPVSKELDLSQTKVEFSDGLLTIRIPINKEETYKTFLLGK
jgi:HSP20 family molecular chaperone IbpA